MFSCEDDSCTRNALSRDIYDYTISLVICACIYAAHFLIASYTIHALYNAKTATRTRWNLIIFVSVLLTLGTVNWVSFARVVLVSMGHTIESSIANITSLEHITRRYGSQAVEIPALMILVLSEGYMVYRCSLIWSRNRLVLLPLVLLYLCLIGLGITAEVTTFGSNQTLTGPLVHTPPSHPDSPFSFAFWIALLVFNAILTTLIVVRLLVVRARIIETMGKQYGKTYTGPMAIFIESAILYDLFVTVGYLCLPTVPRVGNMFTPTIAQVQCIATELIILRFSLGRGYSDHVAKSVEAGQQPRADAIPEEPKGLAEHPRFPPRVTTSTHSNSMFPSSVAAVLRSYDSRF